MWYNGGMVEQVVGGSTRGPNHPKGPQQPGNCHDVADQLRISPRRLRYILRRLSPPHLRCHRGKDGSPSPTWGKLSPTQVAMITNYVLGTAEEKKNLRKNVPRVDLEFSPPPDSPSLF